MYVQDHDLRNHPVSRGNEIGHSKTQASFNTLTALAFLISAWTGDIPFQKGMIFLGGTSYDLEYNRYTKGIYKTVQS